MKTSKQSICRFIQKFLELQGTTPYFFIQVLTFRSAMTGRNDAKKYLKRFFDALGKATSLPKWAALYVEEKQGNGNLHYHVCFFFYLNDTSISPETLRKKLKPIIFSYWKQLHDEKHYPISQYNKLTGGNSDVLAYLLKQKSPARTIKEQGKPLWYGVRNVKTIPTKLNAVPIETIKDIYKIHFPPPDTFPVSKSVFTSRKYGWKQLREERREIKDSLYFSWAEYKREFILNRNGVKIESVGDADFIAFRNQCAF